MSKETKPNDEQGSIGQLSPCSGIVQHDVSIAVTHSECFSVQSGNLSFTDGNTREDEDSSEASREEQQELSLDLHHYLSRNLRGRIPLS